jgi:tetratricopeptide (TPR) repeat protein
MKKVFIFLLLIVPFFYLPGKDLSLAETYYKNRDYGAFIEEIKQVLKDSPKLKEDVTLNAKIAYALSRENRYDDAEVVWRRLTSKNYCTIKDYFWWYRGLNMLNKGDTLKALTIWKEGMNDVPEYSLISRIKYSYSEISAAVHHYKEAQIVLIDLDEKGDYVGYPKDFIWNLIVKYSLITGNEEVVDRYFQKMVTYRPGSKYTYQMAEKFDYFSKALKGSKEDKKKAIKILMGNKKYKECLGYISVLKREDNGSMARALMFYQAEVYFSQKNIIPLIGCILPLIPVFSARQPGNRYICREEDAFTEPIEKQKLIKNLRNLPQNTRGGENHWICSGWRQWTTRKKNNSAKLLSGTER